MKGTAKIAQNSRKCSLKHATNVVIADELRVRGGGGAVAPTPSHTTRNQTRRQSSLARRCRTPLGSTMRSRDLSARQAEGLVPRSRRAPLPVSQSPYG